MTRPTTEEVDEALNEADGCKALVAREVRSEQFLAAAERAMIALAAEVRALRTVIDGLNGALEVLTDAEIEGDKLRATLACVQELPGKWRDIVQRVLHPSGYAVHEAVMECAKDLEEALRGAER